jgi:hypothetical protein
MAENANLPTGEQRAKGSNDNVQDDAGHRFLDSQIQAQNSRVSQADISGSPRRDAHQDSVPLDNLSPSGSTLSQRAAPMNGRRGSWPTQPDDVRSTGLPLGGISGISQKPAQPDRPDTAIPTTQTGQNVAAQAAFDTQALFETLAGAGGKSFR